MLKIVLWLLLSALSCGGAIVYALQQQYAAQSAEFRILYRDITVKLSQHDVVLSLLTATSDPAVVRQKFPQILRWQPRLAAAPPYSLNPAGQGTYWLNAQRFALLIDLNRLLADLPQTHYFKYLNLKWHDSPLITLNNGEKHAYWQWDKALVSPSQPFILSAANNPDWTRLPWLMLLAFCLFWGAIVYFVDQYRAHKHQRHIADLRAHFSELTRLNAMGEIAAGIVHELNQPLTAILSYNQAAIRLIQQQQTQSVPPLLDGAVVQAKRISALLLEFRQKLNSGQTVFQPVNLSQIWTRVVTLLEKELHGGKIRVTNQIPENLPNLLAVPLWIEQIFHNLLTNAIQAQQHNAKGAAWVNIHAHPSASGVTLTVSDGGPGLSQQALQEVFMPFFTTRPDGLGLGMALTETLIQRLNGSIKVENIAGQGACFTLWLPFNPEEE